MMILKLLLVLLFTVPVWAENLCMDYLLAGKYPQEVIKNHPNGFGCGFIYEVDGSPKTDKVITKLLATGKCPKIRIHLTWKDSHVFSEADIPVAVRKAKEVALLVEKFPKVQFYVSPWLEHRAELRVLQKLKKEVMKVLPSRVKYVNSFVSGGAYFPGVINEVHHTLTVPKGPHIHSFDGLDQLDADMNKYKDLYKNAEMFCGWSWFKNSKVSKKDTTPRKDRKLVPQDRMLGIIELQLKNRYPENHKLLPGRIYKAYAEAHLDKKGQADSRSYAMTYLTTKRPKEVLFKVKGKVLVTLKATGSLHGNQMIYRSIYNPFALDVWNKAKQINPDGMVNIWEDGLKVGMVQPIFRCGDYRNVDL